MLRGSHTVAQAPPESGDANVQGSLVPLLMFAAGPGTITAVVTLAAVHTPDGADDGAHRRSRRHSRNICRIDPRRSPWTPSRSGHASDRHTLYGSYRIIDGNAVRAGQPEGLV